MGASEPDEKRESRRIDEVDIAKVDHDTGPQLNDLCERLGVLVQRRIVEVAPQVHPDQPVQVCEHDLEAFRFHTSAIPRMKAKIHSSGTSRDVTHDILQGMARRRASAEGIHSTRRDPQLSVREHPTRLANDEVGAGVETIVLPDGIATLVVEAADLTIVQVWIGS